MHSRLVTVMFTACMLVSFYAAANDGTPPWIHELEQKGQDVLINIAIIDKGEPGMGASYDIIRNKAGDQESEPGTAIVENRIFNANDAVNISEPGCRWWEMEPEGDYCVKNPAECEDCDDDGKRECWGWCETTHYFDIVDECVQPGTWSYSLLQSGDDWDIATEQIAVTDSGEECSPASDSDSDSDTDTDSDSDSDSDTDSDSDSDSDSDDSGNVDDADEDPGGTGCSIMPGRNPVHVPLHFFVSAFEILFL